ncbi:MAG: type I-F CRISPR-associated helicase Cas3 [Xanthomonadaceae bacterium]|nr:type I-F CRISPR-associated helicase Cas3 [Xanthomonadaceae bacterium]MDE2248268.1 type I-F CRISPR-associated helicase Cas3 [Xanthomonadaceae bacterium]
MNILLISQCSKRALTETRRILDQFAERRGDRTWQTPITRDGLDTLRRLLRKTARKNTAVACHWIRGLDHSELLWVVGDASQFNEQGAVPTNTTQADVLRRKDENDWHGLHDIHLLCALAALLHDLGKACLAFQMRLKNPLAERNQYRHEWISLRLFQAFVGPGASDEAWLRRLTEPTAEDDASWLAPGRLQRDGLDTPVDAPLATLPPLAQAVAWLVVTHHRLPVMPSRDEKGRPRWLGAKVPDFRASQLNDLLGKIGPLWNELPTTDDRKVIEAYWQFPQGLPVTTPLWRNRAARLTRQLWERLRQPDNRPWLDDPYVMHVARLGLMLADHHYSGLTKQAERERGEPGYPVYANTDRATGDYNQPLDEHLLGVEKHAGTITHALPGFERKLPRLVRHKGLRRRSQDERFRWQDRAADLAASMRERARHQGAFIVNMASTGCGKTLANARIMNALADPQQGLRCAFALGLRTLTLQTGRAFRDAMHLSDDELAIRVGGTANRELFAYHERLAERSGSASTQALLPDDGHVFFEGSDTHPLLHRAMKDPQVRALLAAPLLVCTIDHLVPATESQRGGHQIAPMLRLMSGDLVLDELDDFDLADLPALTRLVYWAGLLGTRLLLSSATLPPALVQGMFQAYRAGRAAYQRNRGERPGMAVEVCCAWVDEFDQARADCVDTGVFEAAHHAFVERRHARLGRDIVRRRSELVPPRCSDSDPATIRRTFAETLRESALQLHTAHHVVDTHSHKRVSFGLVRMANIEPLFDVALALYRLGAPANVHIHLCTYHSQFPLLIRSAIEQRLDQALDRRQPQAVFDLPDIRALIDRHAEQDQLFVVLGSPVTEVGRDHDYDWAVVEPSSMRSLIQLAGRVRRHRAGPCETANLHLLERNLRSVEHPGQAAYCRPGFEQNEGPFHLLSHSLASLLDEDERTVIDARPRILSRPPDRQRPSESLVDLEHARLAQCMLPSAETATPMSERERRRQQAHAAPLNASSIWMLPQAHLTGVLAQQLPFREDATPRVELVLLPDEDEENYALHRIDPGKRRWESIYVRVDASLNQRVPDAQVQGPGIAPWGETDYMAALGALSESLDMDLRDCARRYGTVTLPDSQQGWRFHPALGFSRSR